MKVSKVSKYKYPPYPPGRVPAAAADPVKHDGYSMSLKADSSEGQRGPEGVAIAADTCFSV